MNFLEFLETKKNTDANIRRFDESFKENELNKAHNLIADLVGKKLGCRCLWIPSFFDTKIDGKKMKSFLFLCGPKDKVNDTIAFTLNYRLNGKSAEVYSIDFFNESKFNRMFWSGERLESNLSIFTLGTSVAYFIPIIVHVMKNDDYELNEETAKKLGDKTIQKISGKNESRTYHYGAVKYNIYENYTSEDIDIVFNNRMEILETEAEEFRRKKSAELTAAKKTGDSEKVRQLTNEYSAIAKAIRGGATTINEINMTIRRGTKFEVLVDAKTEDAEVAFDKKSKDAGQVFKEMQMYIKSVIKGLQPGLIICGGPGSGKSYRVMKQLKANNFNDGHNMFVIKGKCSTRALYTTLFEYKDKGNIVVIDDADSLVGPKAPEDCINILKAALDNPDTADGRKISYKVAGKILDDDGVEIPKQFYYKGGVIVITNYFVGQLDTALRNRVFTQNIDFTTKQLLELIKELIPAIDPVHLSMDAKTKAYEYLLELDKKGTNMEISIRSFGMCARIFQVCDGEQGFSDDDAKSMIAEQMENMFERGGKKY